MSWHVKETTITFVAAFPFEKCPDNWEETIMSPLGVNIVS